MEPVTGAALALVAAKAVGSAAGKELAARVGDLVGLVDAQKTLLADIGRDVTALVQGPQKTPLSLIADAAVVKSAETRRDLLERARSELDRAAAQETDPLRQSSAWLLSSALWTALDEGESGLITKHLRNAYDCAVAAAKGMEDPAPEPPRAVRYLAGPLRLLVGGVVVKRVPRSLRIALVTETRAPLVGVARAQQYMATDTARERERRLVEVHRYSCGLRELLIARGSPKPASRHIGFAWCPGRPWSLGGFLPRRPCGRSRTTNSSTVTRSSRARTKYSSATTVAY
jgi:hypothetical protein